MEPRNTSIVWLRFAQTKLNLINILEFPILPKETRIFKLQKMFRKIRKTYDFSVFPAKCQVHHQGITRALQSTAMHVYVT
jgi:hypothetical protein